MKYITKALKEKNVTQKDLIRDLEVSQPYASALFNGKKPIGKAMAEKLSKLYGLDYINLLVDREPVKKDSNAKFIGVLGDKEDLEGDTKYTEISPGRYRMKVKFVADTAKAGFLNGFKDPEYIEELPFREITVDFFPRGKYMAFEAEGDSMDDRSIYAIPDKTILTARELDQDKWRPKLHSHKYPNWIFVHKYEGILVKQIASQDFEAGVITLRSLNPNKTLFPDKELLLKDICAIYNVVKRELPF